MIYSVDYHGMGYSIKRYQPENTNPPNSFHAMSFTAYLIKFVRGLTCLVTHAEMGVHEVDIIVLPLY